MNLPFPFVVLPVTNEESGKEIRATLTNSTGRFCSSITVPFTFTVCAAAAKLPNRYMIAITRIFFINVGV